MSGPFLVLPMFAMVLLTFAVLVMLFRRRVQAVQRGEVSAGYYKTHQGQTESDESLKLSRHFVNLFEAPVLFYVVCLAALATDHSTATLQVLAWLYVAARFIHAFVHVGANKLPFRIAAYFSSWIVLLSMWAYLVVQIVQSVGT